MESTIMGYIGTTLRIPDYYTTPASRDCRCSSVLELHLGEDAGGPLKSKAV